MPKNVILLTADIFAAQIVRMAMALTLIAANLGVATM